METWIYAYIHCLIFLQSSLRIYPFAKVCVNFTFLALFLSAAEDILSCYQFDGYMTFVLVCGYNGANLGANFVEDTCGILCFVWLSCVDVEEDSSIVADSESSDQC